MADITNQSCTFPTEIRLNLGILLNPELQLAPAINQLTSKIKSKFSPLISAWSKLYLAFLVPQPYSLWGSFPKEIIQQI